MSRKGNEREGQDDRSRWSSLNSTRHPSSAYRLVIGDLTEVKERDFATAFEIVARIQRAINFGGWTRNEGRRLQRLKAKWLRRAKGEDVRFNVVGTRKTGLSAEQRRQVELIKSLRFYPQTDGECEEANNGVR